MKIGLISDTHLATPVERLPYQVEIAFRDVDLILHAGDIWIPSVLDELESIAPVMAAWGDDDMETDLGGDLRMLEHRTIFVDGAILWVMHEKPAYGTIVPRANRVFHWKTEETREIPDAVIYGHTHIARVEKHGGVVIVNPGSPTWPNNVPELGTVGLLTIESGRVEAHLVPLSQLQE